MNRWGTGVFESDSALDFLWILNDNLMKQIVFYIADESLIGWWIARYEEGIAAADLLALWCEKSGSSEGIHKKNVIRWRELYLQRFETDPQWDNALTPDGLDARTERRKVIEATFDRLEAVAMDDED